MLNIIKRTCAAFAAAVLALNFSVCAFAVESRTELRDDADLFTDSREEQLVFEMDKLCSESGWNVLIYTNNEGVDEDSIKEFANNYYANLCGKDSSGVMLTIDMESRNVDFRAKGDAMLYFGNDRTDALLDEVQDDLYYSDYYEAAEYFISYAGSAYSSGQDEQAIEEQNSIAEKENSKLLYVIKNYGIFIVLIGIGAGIAVVAITWFRYKHNGAESAYDLLSNSSLKLTDSKDIFVTKHVTVTHIDNDQHHGGPGSTSSHSSGGASAGGSRHF